MVKIILSFVLGVVLTVCMFLASGNLLMAHRCAFWNDDRGAGTLVLAVNKGWIVDGTYAHDQVICYHRPLLYYLTDELPVPSN